MSGLHLQDIVDNTLNFSANFTEDGFIYELLAAYGISNANIQRMRQSKTPYVLNWLEKLIHNFFTGANLEIEINGRHPREWFQVPLDVVDRAINMIISGQIIYYQYNPEIQDIELV